MTPDLNIASAAAARNEGASIRNIRRTAGILAGLVVAYAAVLGIYTWFDEQSTAGKDLTTVAELEATAINSYFTHLERDLKGLGQELSEGGHPLQPERAYPLVKRFNERHAELFNVTLVQPDGQILLTAKNPPGTVLASLAKEPSFIAFLEEFKQGKVLAIGQPLVSAITKVVIVPVRFGVMDSQGSLRFIVSANLPHAYLHSFWMNAPIAATAAIGLMRDNGFLLSRYPVPPESDLGDVYGKPRTGALIEWLRKYGYPAGGLVSGGSSTERIDVLFAFRRLASYPVTLFVALPRSEIRAAWLNRTGGTFLALLFFFVAGVMAYRHAIRLQITLENERRQNENTRQDALDHLRKIASRVPGVVYQYRIHPDGSSCFPYASEAIRDIYRVSPEEVRQDASKVLAQLHPEDGEGVVRSIQQSAKALTPWIHEYRTKFADGTVRWLMGNAVAEREPDGSVLWHGFITDITERKAMEEVLHQLAFHDALTLLPNRRLLIDHLVLALASCRRTARSAALLFLDLDNFKLLNDTAGHAVGDQLLIEVARRLKCCVRETDTVARFGGDEFVVLIGELDGDTSGAADKAGAIARKMSLALAAPYLLAAPREGNTGARVEHRCTVSIGVALLGTDTWTVDSALGLADQAMYRAKQLGRNSICFMEVATKVDGRAEPVPGGSGQDRSTSDVS